MSILRDEVWEIFKREIKPLWLLLSCRTISGVYLGYKPTRYLGDLFFASKKGYKWVAVFTRNPHS